jgi:hypothetical protein
MNFIQKLIKDTTKGDWDGNWKYAGDSYSLQKQKHYLSGLNFSPIKFPVIIFPNGFAVEYDKASLESLKKAVDESLERTVDEFIKLYLAGKEMTPEQEQLEKETEAKKQQSQTEKPKAKEKSDGKKSI